jgi:membrane protease YdiL (CAAX protease family)
MSLGLSAAPWARHAGRLTWAALRRVILPTCGIVAMLLPLALMAGHIRFEPMVHPLLPLFVVHNLLLVAMPEEVLFRGMLPHLLRHTLPAPWATPGRIWVLAALAFGLGHLGGGPAYALLSFLAGLGYAAAAHRAGGLAGSILAHTAVNVVHFVLFTYPALR